MQHRASLSSQEVHLVTAHLQSQSGILHVSVNMADLEGGVIFKIMLLL